MKSLIKSAYSNRYKNQNFTNPISRKNSNSRENDMDDMRKINLTSSSRAIKEFKDDKFFKSRNVTNNLTNPTQVINGESKSNN